METMQIKEKPSALWLIEKYLECRRSLKALTDRYEEEAKPYKEGMETVESLLGDEINRLEGQAIKTAAGTAYRSTVTSFRVADREMWLDWVFTNDQRDMLTSHVAKDAVKEFTEMHETPPPGLNMTLIYKINVRSADQ